MNQIDNIINADSRNQACIDGKWVAARPLNFTRSFTSLRFRIKEAWNVITGKAETLYYYKQ